MKSLTTLGTIAATVMAFIAVCVRRHAMRQAEFAFLFALLCGLLYAMGDDTETFAGGIAGAFSDIVAIPDAVKATILPGFERLLATTKVDTKDFSTAQMLSRTSYESDPALQKKGKFDEAAFLRLAQDYKRADDALIAMRDYDKDTYTLLTSKA